MRQLRNFSVHNQRANVNSSGNPTVDALTQEAMRKYGSLDEDELVNKLAESIESSKRAGTFNPAELERMAKMMMPYLSQAQREKMTNLLRLIESE